jgi:hypothetical protein
MDYDELDAHHFSIFSYENFYENIKEDFGEINKWVTLYKKEKDNLDDRENSSEALLAKIKSSVSILSIIFDYFYYCASSMEYLPFWSIIPKDYKIPKEYFTKLQGKSIVKHLYEEAFKSEEIFTYIQSELVRLFRERLSHSDGYDILLFYRGSNMDSYYRKNLALLFDFSDIFNRATLKNDKLCMRAALQYMASYSRIISTFLYLLETDMCRLRDFSEMFLTTGDTR